MEFSNGQIWEMKVFTTIDDYNFFMVVFLYGNRPQDKKPSARIQFSRKTK